MQKETDWIGSGNLLYCKDKIYFQFPIAFDDSDSCAQACYGVTAGLADKMGGPARAGA